MRTKTAVLGAAAVAAGALSSMAQNVYSVNVVGYVNVVIPHGYSTIANPLNATDNSINALFAFNSTNGAAPALGCTVFTFNGSTFVGNQNDPYGAGWGNPTFQLPPGVGYFFQNGGTAFTNTFVGTVPQGVLSNNVPVGFSFSSSQVPQAGFIQDLGLVASPGDTVFMWSGTAFVGIQLDPYGSGWPAVSGFTIDPAKGPFLNVGQSLFYQGAGGATWVRNFTVQ